MKLFHADYQKYLLSVLPDFLSIERDRVLKLEVSTAKLYLLNLDKVHPVTEKFYSNTGQPAKNQQSIIRSLVLMLDKLVKLAIKDRLPQNHHERVFQQLLARCVVDTSADMGILGDAQHLSAAT